MDTTLTSFIWIWITLILVVNLFGIVGLFIGADMHLAGATRGQGDLQPVQQRQPTCFLELLILSWRTPFWQGDFGKRARGAKMPVGGRAHDTSWALTSTVSFSGDTH